MSSSGPPPAAPTFEASKCALIIARAVASFIENPPSYGPPVVAPRRLTVRRLQRGDGHGEAASEGGPATLRRRPRDASSFATHRSLSARRGRPQRQATRRQACGRGTGLRLGRECASSQTVASLALRATTRRTFRGTRTPSPARRRTARAGRG